MLNNKLTMYITSKIYTTMSGKNQVSCGKLLELFLQLQCKWQVKSIYSSFILTFENPISWLTEILEIQ